MSDLIERQAAIDAICDNCNTVQASCPHYPCGRYVAVKKIPPTQPETATVVMRYGFTMWYACGACGVSIDYEDCYCRNCGRKLKHE